MQTFIVRRDGIEVARVSGEGITPGKRNQSQSLHTVDLVDDPHLLRLIVDGETVLVFYVSTSKNVSIEKESP